MAEDTPRSTRSNLSQTSATPRSQTSPRDDRFFTPRTIARSNSASNSDEWGTPRDFTTPRAFYDSEGKKPDSARGLGGSYKGAGD